MEKLKVLELFSGIGACSKALERLGIDFEIVDSVEIDKYAVKSFNAIHGTNFEPQDICEWDKDIEVDLITHGSPCFVKGTQIITKDGYKCVENIKTGDMVLTHRNNFQKVLKIGYNRDETIYKLKAMGMFDTFVTGNHPYYVITKTKKWNNITRRYDYQYSNPYWKEVKDLTLNDYVGMNIPNVEENLYKLDEETCWLLGRYVADGHIRYYKRKNRKNSYQYGVIYSIGNSKIEDFKTHLTKFHASIHQHTKSCFRAIINSQELVNFIQENNFGEGSINKKIPQLILDLPKNLAKSFLDGYMSGDGAFTNNEFKATSVSKELIMGIELLVAKIYSIGSSLYYTKRPKTTIIEGRLVNQKDSYSIAFRPGRKRHSWIVKDNKIWYPVKCIECLDKKETVYNLEVDNDNSYTANNFIVHNCQDFSLAGKQAGGDKDSGTRSSLMYETIRIVEKLKPKYVIWENVKNLLSKKHRHNFDAYLETMENLGYTNYYQVLNAKDYSIPQNRERVFTISILGDDAFNFPPKQELKLKLKDILEDNVDEKYYLSDEQVNKIKYSKFAQEKARLQEKDYSDTLFARDWKDPKCIEVNRKYGIFDTEKQTHQAGSVYDENGLAPTLDTMQGGWRQPCIEEKSFVQNKYEKFIEEKGYIPEMFNPYNEKEVKDVAPTQSTYCGSMTSSATVLIKNNTKQGYLEASDGDGCYIQNIDRKRGTVQKEMIPTLKTSPDIGCVVADYPKGVDITWNAIGDTTDVARTLTTACRTLSKSQMTTGVLENNLRIRKLTPKECWRLMGFDDEDFEKAEKVNSNTQLYKQAGNSIVVNVLEAIFKNLLKDYLWSDLD